MKLKTYIIPLPIFTYIVVLTVYASSCYKTSGSYVYFTYCSGYCSGSYGHETCDYSYYYYYYDGFYYSM